MLITPCAENTKNLCSRAGHTILQREILTQFEFKIKWLSCNLKNSNLQIAILLQRVCCLKSTLAINVWPWRCMGAGRVRPCREFIPGCSDSVFSAAFSKKKGKESVTGPLSRFLHCSDIWCPVCARMPLLHSGVCFWRYTWISCLLHTPTHHKRTQTQIYKRRAGVRFFALLKTRIKKCAVKMHGLNKLIDSFFFNKRLSPNECAPQL